jgi:hypothetical protein
MGEASLLIGRLPTELLARLNSRLPSWIQSMKIRCDIIGDVEEGQAEVLNREASATNPLPYPVRENWGKFFKI